MSDPLPATLAVDEHGGWANLLGIVTRGDDLTHDQARAAMTDILAGRATAAQIAGLIVALRVKGESVIEMTGLATAMHDAAEPLRLPGDALDIVGTGGSIHRRKHALNVSTMACFVAAGAGATVCKHGNFRASSTSGAFDFLQELGVDAAIAPATLESCVAETGLGFALARTFHPAMRHAGPVRAELGIPTVFNVLGPLAHPGRVRRQVVGTSDEELAGRMASVLLALGVEHAWVVAGHDGLDELSTMGPNTVFEVRDGAITRSQIDPLDLGLPRPASMDDLAGGDAAANRAIFSAMCGGKRDARTDIVVLNAAAGLVVGGIADDLAAGIDAARDALTDGSTTNKLAEVVAACA